MHDRAKRKKKKKEKVSRVQKCPISQNNDDR